MFLKNGRKVITCLRKMRLATTKWRRFYRIVSPDRRVNYVPVYHLFSPHLPCFPRWLNWVFPQTSKVVLFFHNPKSNYILGLRLALWISGYHSGLVSGLKFWSLKKITLQISMQVRNPMNNSKFSFFVCYSNLTKS